MNAKTLKFSKILALGILISLFTVSTVFAITIIVDGTREGAWSGGGSVADDGGNEGTIRDGNDIDRLEYTNDSTYYYILLDTFASTIWNNAFGADPNLYICLNVDNAVSGVTGVAQCDNGNMTGIDFILEFLGGATVTFNIYDSSFNIVTDANKQFAFTGDISEIRVTASAIGLSSTNCIASMPTSIYFDNGVVDPEDYTPNNGTVTFGCGAPTAITLTDLTATPNTSAALVGAAGLVLLGTAFILLRRSRKHVYATSQED